MKNIILLLDDNDIDEMEWLKVAATNPVFDFLSEIEEDIYSLEDGKLFHLESSNELGNKKEAES